MRWSRWGARVLAAMGAVVLVGVGTPTAHADTEYDGSATALQVEGLRLELFPELPDGVDLPPELARAPRTIVVPDTVEGHAQYQGSDTKLELPDNPLLSLEAVEARSNNVDGRLVSEASVTGLRLASGVLSADVVKARCTADGSTIELSAPQAALQTSSPLAGTVELEPGRTNSIPGIGRITFNQQERGDGAGSVSNIVVALDSDLSLDALRQIPQAAREFEDTLQEVLADLSADDAPPELQQDVGDPQALTGEPLFSALEDVVNQLPADQVPPQLRDLNEVAHLSGTITIASATCAQEVVEQPAPAPDPERDEPAVAHNRTGPAEPPLADTGSPMGIAGAGLGGLVALVAGAWTLLRIRRR